MKSGSHVSISKAVKVPFPWASVRWLVQCILECHWNTTGWPSVHWDTTGRPSEYLQGTLEHHWRNLVETAPHWDATGETLTFAAYTGPPLEGLQQPTHAPVHIVKQSSIHACLQWQDGGTPISKWKGLCKFSLYFEFTTLQWIPVLLLKHVPQHHSVHAFDMSTIIVFVYLGLRVKWNQFKSNNSHHASCIHKGIHAGKRPYLMNSKPDSVSTLEYNWTDHTGRPLEPQVHWVPLEPHWLMLALSGVPVAIQC